MAGRPRGTDEVELDRRRKEFLRLVTTGAEFDQACADAKLQPWKALAILSQPEVRDIIRAAA